MKLNRNANTANLATKDNQHIDVKTWYKKYIQSYLHWMYEQNNDFLGNLTTDELCNFFINELNHPLWFQLYLSLMTFRVIVETDNYIEKYKKNAEKMIVDIPITPINGEGITTVPASMIYKKADIKEIDDIRHYIDEYQLKMPDEVSEIDVALFGVLVRKEHKNVK